MLNADDGWQVNVLDFINGVPGMLESSEAIYIQTCHPDDRDFPNNAAALGYNAIPEDRQGREHQNAGGYIHARHRVTTAVVLGWPE